MGNFYYNVLAQKKGQKTKRPDLQTLSACDLAMQNLYEFLFILLLDIGTHGYTCEYPGGSVIAKYL